MPCRRKTKEERCKKEMSTLLRKIFGPNKEEVWKQLCNEIGAEYINNGIWKGDKVLARVKE